MKNLFLIILAIMLVACGESPKDQASSSDFTWLCDYSSHPFACTPDKENQAYHNTTDGNSYICHNLIWTVLANAGDDGKDGENATNNHPVTISNPSGFAIAASCLSRGDVNLTALDENYMQLNDYPTTTKNDKGEFKINANVSGVKARTSFRGYCYRETADGTVYMSMDVYHNLSDNVIVNIPGTIQLELATYYFEDATNLNYQNMDGALTTAKTNILDYFGYFGLSNIDFSTGTIQGNTENDAVMTAISSIVDSRHNTGPEMNDDISTIAYGIYTNDATLKTQIGQDRDALKIKDIKNRIKGLVGSSAPIELLPGVPEYYNDVLNGTHEVIESTNLDQTGSCAIDTSEYNSFAYIIDLTTPEQAVYFASELTGNLSIWSTAVCDNGIATFTCPGSKLVGISELREVLFDLGLSYNGKFDSHSLTAGRYFIVQEFETGTAPSHNCTGEMTGTDRNLATIDNNWPMSIGWNNNWSWFRRKSKTALIN
jgi:hypothetical protein